MNQMQMGPAPTALVSGQPATNTSQSYSNPGGASFGVPVILPNNILA